MYNVDIQLNGPQYASCHIVNKYEYIHFRCERIYKQQTQ